MREKRDQGVVAVVGVGYVGLPLCLAFGRVRSTIGFDQDSERIKQLQSGLDRNREHDAKEFDLAKKLIFTFDETRIADANTYVVAVPTPVDSRKQPDLSILESATRTVGRLLKPGNLVVFESTVFPGATEEVCIPILQEQSHLIAGKDFHVGYSPERINPGDKSHSLTQVTKVVSGNSQEALDQVDDLYSGIIDAGTHRAPSIRVAEAAKVIENVQRDVNIALINELSVLFRYLDLDTHEVLRAAATKWNFLPFQPGLVGGHCIGVDPYYLTHKAIQVGFEPRLILAGRQINDGMGDYVSERVIQRLSKQGFPLLGQRALVLGLTYKENCSDLRNSQVPNIVAGLRAAGLEIDVVDPLADGAAAMAEYGIELIELSEIRPENYVAVVVAVSHQDFDAIQEYVGNRLPAGAVIFDVKGTWSAEHVDERL